MFKFVTHLIFIAFATSAGAQAQSERAMAAAAALGRITASQDYCALDFNMEALDAWTRKEIGDEPMTFSNAVSSAATSERIRQDLRTAAEKVVHCVAVEQSARQNGFLRNEPDSDHPKG